MRIYEVPRLKWRYVHNCPYCGCHNVTQVALAGRYPFERVVVCSLCGRGRSRPIRHEDTEPKVSPYEVELEIERAIEKAKTGRFRKKVFVTSPRRHLW